MDLGAGITGPLPGFSQPQEGAEPAIEFEPVGTSHLVACETCQEDRESQSCLRPGEDHDLACCIRQGNPEEERGHCQAP